MNRLTIRDIQSRKQKTPIVCMTAYTYPMAQIADSLVDILLVGDSLGMVIYGMESTLPVTLPLMIAHGQAVMRGSQKAMVVVDLPFGSYQSSPSQAFEAAALLMQETGCHAVKLEGGAFMASTVRFLVERGIPVMAHIGVMPQYVHALGGYGFQGRDADDAEKLMKDARALQEAGAFAIVLEGIRETVAHAIAQTLTIPTIGIGASPSCDGQVLVCDDLLGVFTNFTPKFVKRYADLSINIKEAISTYAQEVRNGTFPTLQHCFKGNDPEQ